jgi:hypothetical protein
MESLTRLVTESLARHGFDRPLDYRRLQWSRWFRCESHHSLLVVPSKPGVFALAEEIMDIGNAHVDAHVATAAKPALSTVEEAALNLSKGAVPRSEASGAAPRAGSREPEAAPRRMLAVTQFFEDDDMAFVLDRMLSRHNSMAARLTSGRYFARFVVIEDATQRRSICNALNQWIVNSAEKATGIGSHFASSLELTDATEYIEQPDPNQRSLFEYVHADVHAARAPSPATANSPEAPGSQFPTAATVTFARQPVQTTAPLATTPLLDSGAASNRHCPTPLPSGF